MAQPAYLDVYNQMKHKILHEFYPASTFLPTESELEQVYNVSRTTIRKAMKLLSDDGLVEITQGRGTMVLDRKMSQNLNFTTAVPETLCSSGNCTMTTKSCYIDKVLPEPGIARQLYLSENEKAVRIQRIQQIDDEPVCIMTNYIPENLVPGMEKDQHDFSMLYEYLQQQYGLTINRTDSTISAASADFAEAQILNVEPGFPLLIIQRICHDSQGKPIGLDLVHVLSSHYKVHFSTFSQN